MGELLTEKRELMNELRKLTYSNAAWHEIDFVEDKYQVLVWCFFSQIFLLYTISILVCTYSQNVTYHTSAAGP